jgi:hypothetical protein
MFGLAKVLRMARPHTSERAYRWSVLPLGRSAFQGTRRTMGIVGIPNVAAYGEEYPDSQWRNL